MIQREIPQQLKRHTTDSTQGSVKKPILKSLANKRTTPVAMSAAPITCAPKDLNMLIVFREFRMITRELPEELKLDISVILC